MTVKTLAMRAGLVVALTASLGACASSQIGGGDTVSRDAVRGSSEVEYGVVVDARQVRVQGTRSGVGAVGGAAVGAAVGSQIGGGTGERVAAGVVGGVVGAIAGDAIEEGVTQQNAIEYTVRLQSGRTIKVVQADRYIIRNGARVEVVYDRDGTTRIVEYR